MSTKPIETYPRGAVECAAGDHLLHQTAGGKWVVLLVEDLVRLERLVPLRPSDGPAVGLIDEASMLDSVAPAYANEVYLLVTEFAGELASIDDAKRAVEAGALEVRARGLCRKLGDFPRTTTVAFRPASAAPAADPAAPPP